MAPVLGSRGHGLSDIAVLLSVTFPRTLIASER